MKFLHDIRIKSTDNIYEVGEYCLKYPKYCATNELICEHILNISGYKTLGFPVDIGKKETFCKIYGELNSIREKIKVDYIRGDKKLANPKMSEKYLSTKMNPKFYIECKKYGSPLLKKFFEFNKI